MKVTFVMQGIGVFGISGGAKAIFEFANHLHDRGHDVSVIYPLIPMRSGAEWSNLRKLAGRALQFVLNLKQGNHVEWFDLKANLIRTLTLAQRYIPDADIVVATWWETAYYVSKYSKNKGGKVYLIQHYETWGGPEEEVNNTYKLGLHNIVNSNWLNNILQDKLRAPVEAVILHAPDRKQFFPERIDRDNDTIRVLLPYRRIKWKGMEDGIKAFEMARERHPDIQLVTFGDAPNRGVARYAEWYGKTYGDKLRKIYNSCDIFLFPSHYEGFGLPPMEAMACRLPVVTTNVGAIPDYTIPGETALVSPPGSPELLAENLIRLIEDEELRRRIAEAGYDYTKKFTWDRATDMLEQAFNKALDERKQ